MWLPIGLSVGSTSHFFKSFKSTKLNLPQTNRAISCNCELCDLVAARPLLCRQPDRRRLQWHRRSGPHFPKRVFRFSLWRRRHSVIMFLNTSSVLLLAVRGLSRHQAQRDVHRSSVASAGCSGQVDNPFCEMFHSNSSLRHQIKHFRLKETNLMSTKK
jgi:hypothetical protein